MSENAYYSPDGGVYCEMCATDEMEAYPDGGGEADTPQHCEECGRPLDNPLTDYGVRYVLDACRDELRKGRAEYTRMIPKAGTAEETMTYWHGCRHVDITRGWAEQLQSYGGLADADARFIDRFLSWTTKERKP